MRIVRLFSNYSLAEQVLFLNALFVLAVIKVSLFLLPFKTVHRLIISRVSKKDSTPSNNVREISQVTWAVRAASHYVPRATCLPQALVVQLLLGQRGYSSELRIGLVQDETGQIKGHAWVEREGQVIIGGDEISKFILLRTSDSMKMNNI